MAKPSQEYLIEECNNLLKIIQGQFEKINQSFYCKEMDLCISEYVRQEPLFLQTSNSLNKIMGDMEKVNSILKEDIKKNKIDEFMKFDF